MIARSAQISFYYQDNGYLASCFSAENFAPGTALFWNITDTACGHSGTPNEGDYLRWNILGGGWGAEWSETASGVVYSFTIQYSYVTTAAQEDVVANRVASVISSLNLSGKSNYEKINAIYQYLTENVTYDYAHLDMGVEYPTMFGAYGALVDGTCVCQGYANAFYRLCLYVGIDARIVTSIDHAWNIVGIDGKYYELDSTWDAGRSWNYFLRGSAFWSSNHDNDGGTLGLLLDRYPVENYYNIPAADYTLTLPTITTQPQNTTVTAGTKATFQITATGSNLSYQWQYRTSASGAWTDAVASGNKTATLTPNAYLSMNGYQYRCKVSNDAGPVYSNIVTLTVKAAMPVITSQPQNTTVSAGTKATFQITATGSNLSYQWQYRTSASGEWLNAVANGNKTATLTPNAYLSMNGYQYRCRVSNAEGTVYSNVVTLTVTP